MTAPNGSTTAVPEVTPARQRALCRLRERYQHDHDLLTTQEWSLLVFLRWLYAAEATATPAASCPPRGEMKHARHGQPGGHHAE